MNNKYERTKRAFTLVEVLVVVVIIGILFIVVMGRVDFTTDTARESGVDTVLKSYQLAANAVGLDRAGFTNDFNSLVDQMNKRLDSELHLMVSNGAIVTMNQDPWGTEFRIQYSQPYKSNGELRFTSAGPDEVFDTGDDIILVSRYDTSTGRGEMVNEYPKNDPYHTHSFTQEIQDPAYLCEEANCITPTLYFNVCECGTVGTTYFSVGSVDYSKHGEKGFTYSALNDEQHLVTTTCNRCKIQIGAEAANHTIDEGQNICLVCGEIYNHTHDYVFMIASDDFIASPADCTQIAKYYYSCSCGAMSNETFDDGTALGHLLANGGSKEIHLYCERCNATISTAHIPQAEVLFDSTCSTLGSTKYTCSCGYSYNEAIQLKPHTPGADANCLDKQQCVVCDTVLADALGHSYANIGIETMHAQCTRCGSVVYEHVMSSSVATEATCISNGTTLYYCECKYSYTRDDIPMNPSNHANKKDPNSNDPEEKFIGTKDVHSVASCCNILVAANHTYSQIILVAPTCNSIGTTKYQCECGYSYNIEEPIVEHVYGAEATCLTPQTCVFCGVVAVESLGHDAVYGGHDSAHEMCDRCGMVLNVDHEYEIASERASTCVTYGVVYYSCYCGSQYDIELALAEHTPKAGSNCLEATTCAICEKTLASGTAHTLSHDNVSENVHGICTVCGEIITQHNLNIQTVAIATCISYEQLLESCQCGYSKQYSNTTKGYNPNVHEKPSVLVGAEDVHEEWECCHVALTTQHTYTSRITTPATCINKGVRTFTCACGYGYTEETAIDRINHAATCKQENGGTKGVHTKWSECNATASSAHSYTSETVNSTCITFGEIIYTCSCGYTFNSPLTSYNPNNHEKGIVFGGTAISHEQYDCCKLVTSKNHTYTVTYGSNCGDSAVGVCECNYTLTEKPTVRYYDDTPANCCSGTILEHTLDFSTFADIRCTPHEEGAKNPNKHKNPTPVAAKLSDICMKYSCCNKTYLTKHSYQVNTAKPSYSGNIATWKATCKDCKYVLTEQVTGFPTVIQTQSCTRPEKTQYYFDFSAPFSDDLNTVITRSRLPHTYAFSTKWDPTVEWGDLLGAHEWCEVQATCTSCALSYTERINDPLNVPNGWLDEAFCPCTQYRVEKNVFDWMFTTLDDQYNRVFDGYWSRCYNGCNHWCPYIPGHSLDGYDTLKPVGTPQKYVKYGNIAIGSCGQASLVYTCGLCETNVTYVGTKLDITDAKYQEALAWIMNNANSEHNAGYCIYRMQIYNGTTDMYAKSYNTGVKYKIYYDSAKGIAYMACNGHPIILM